MEDDNHRELHVHVSKKRDTERSKHVEDSKFGNQTEQSSIDKMSQQTEWRLRNQTKLSEHVGKNQ